MRTFRFLPEARLELLQQIEYYASVREGLGVRFEQAVSDVVRRAVAHPEQGASRARDTRRMLVKKFPFSVIYRVTGDVVLIVAVADSRRRPDYWAPRVR